VPVAQRRADALMRVIELGRVAALQPDVEMRPQYLVTLHVRPGDVRIGDDGAYELGTGVRLHPKLARRLGCDALVQLSVDGDGSHPSSLDRGRTVRLATRDQRRTLLATHAMCGFPGCQAPSSWCQIHHVVDWNANGPTDLDNLLPLCHRHHDAVHKRGWRLVRGPDGRWDAMGPDGRYMWAGPPPASAGQSADAVAALEASLDTVRGELHPGRRGERFDVDDAVIALASRDPRMREHTRAWVGTSTDNSARDVVCSRC
jgi:hypothetical protein